MTKVYKLVVASIVLIMAFSTSGCLSYKVNTDSQQLEAQEQAIRANNTKNIDLMKKGLDLNTKDIGVWKAFWSRPIVATGALLGDVGMIWGGAKAIEYIATDNDEDPGNGGNTSGGDIIIINGDGNTVPSGDTSM